MNDTLSPYETAIMALLDDIASSLRTIAASAPQTTPDYQRRLEEFTGFDWQAIGATVLDTDNDGPAAVEWRGRRYTRRAPQNKFDAAIWFSRAAGRDEDGTVHYERLITFKVQAEPEPLPAKAKQALAAVAPAAQNGKEHGQKAAVLAPPAPSVAPAAPPVAQAATSQPTQPAAGTMVSILRVMPLQPDELKRFIAQETKHARAATPAQTGAVHQALVKVIPDEAARRRFQAWLTGNESMSAWPPAQTGAVYSWLKPSAGNGPTDKWCQEEIGLALDMLRPMAAVDHPVWESAQDAIDWAFRQGVFPDSASAGASYYGQWAAWGRPATQEMFRHWEEYVGNMQAPFVTPEP